MADTANAETRQSFALRYAEQWRGAAWVAILALFLSGVSRAFRLSNERFSALEYVELQDYLVLFLLLPCVFLAPRRFGTAALIIQMLLSASILLSVQHDTGWGSSIADASLAQQIQYSAYDTIAEALTAFGALILLPQGLVALAAKWKRPAQV